MFGRLRRLVSGTRPQRAPSAFSSIIAPEQTVYAVGDIHGCAALLEQVLEKIDSDIEDRAVENPHLIFLGDYVDRGDQSAEVVERLRDLATSMSGTVTCLLGNHEKMLLEFLDDPENSGARWLRNGGLQTLGSYRIGGLSELATPKQLVAARDALQQVLSAESEKWLRTLPLYWKTGNVAYVHASLDPAFGIEFQSEKNCIWGHPNFLKSPRQDGLWVVHGHFAVEQAHATNGRISVDTGAYFSGHLSAAVIENDKIRYLST